MLARPVNQWIADQILLSKREKAVVNIMEKGSNKFESITTQCTSSSRRLGAKGAYLTLVRVADMTL